MSKDYVRGKNAHPSLGSGMIVSVCFLPAETVDYDTILPAQMRPTKYNPKEMRTAMDNVLKIGAPTDFKHVVHVQVID